MKKIFLALSVVFMMASCSSVTKTARTENAPYSMYNATITDLEVSPERVTYTYEPEKAIRRGGLENCKQAAINEVLAKNGNADLLFEPQFVIAERGLFRKKVKFVIVSGRPATYTNFRSMGDDVWTNPVFRGVKAPAGCPKAGVGCPLAK